MKKVLFITIFALAFNLSFLNAQNLALNNTPSATEIHLTTLAWDKTTHDFGKIPQGIPVKTIFKLTNNSEEILLLTEVKTPCGCTVADYSQDPILPGKSTEIIATYNAKKEGQINKTIKVFTNLSDDFIPLKPIVVYNAAENYKPYNG